MEIEEGDVLMCTVDRIIGTVVFVKTESGQEGTIIFSEITAGRVKNIRDWVVPKKKVVCKVLKKDGEKLHLSLRRVSQKEQKEVREQFKQEQSSRNLLKSVVGKDSEKVAKKILEKETVHDFLEESKRNPKELEKIVGEEDAKKILEILNSQKPKTATIKKLIQLNSSENNGLEKIKEVLKDTNAKYVSAGKYALSEEAKNKKEADQKLQEIISKIEESSKKENINFQINKA